MSIDLPQELFQNTCLETEDAPPLFSSEEAPDGSFREFMQKSRKDEEEDCPMCAPCLPQPFRPIVDMNETPSSPIAATFSSAALQRPLPIAFDAIFERMASQMIVMQTSGEVETTLYLDHPRFADSQFFGSRITIREFSTAPKIFNVEIAGTVKAAAAIESAKNDLLSAFQHGNFNFSVHRLDTHIQTEDRPVFHRNDNEERGSFDQEQGGHRQ